jgi:exonuclease VII small subunit
MSDATSYTKKAREALETASYRLTVDAQDRFREQLEPIFESLYEAILNLSYAVDELEQGNQ